MATSSNIMDITSNYSKNNNKKNISNFLFIVITPTERARATSRRACNMANWGPQITLELPGFSRSLIGSQHQQQQQQSLGLPIVLVVARLALVIALLSFCALQASIVSVGAEIELILAFITLGRWKKREREQKEKEAATAALQL